MLRSSPPRRFLLNKSKSFSALELLKVPRNTNPSVIAKKIVPKIMLCRRNTRRFGPLVRNLRFGIGGTASVLEAIVSCRPFVELLLVDETLFRRDDADVNIDIPEHFWISILSAQRKSSLVRFQSSKVFFEKQLI